MVGALLAGPVARAAGQAPSSGVVRTTCSGQRIDEIVLVSRPTLFRAKVPDFVPASAELTNWLRDAQGSVHSATRADAIYPFLLLQPGDPCNERRRAESERVIRSQRYIADATILVYETVPGHVMLVVETTDELSVVADFGVLGRSPYLSRVRLGNPNVLGYGARTVASWRDGRGFRDGYSAEFTKSTLLGMPATLAITGDRAPLGGVWQVSLTQPFLTDFQRFAWSAAASERNSYVTLQRPDTVPLGLPVAQSYRSLSAVGRIGPPGELLLVGASLVTERSSPGAQPFEYGRGVLIPSGDTTLVGRYASHRSVRLGGLLAFRQLKFFRAAGFDVVEGVQDVRTGVELGGSLGRGVRGLGAEDDDWFTTVGLFLGAGNPAIYGYVNALGEGRFSPEQHGWDDMITSGRGQLFVRLSPTQTVVSQLDWSVGMRVRVPFQLTANDPFLGVRGFENSHVAGAERLVWRLEDRVYVGRYRNLAAFSVAPFMDVGRVWGGDAAFGHTSPVLASAGLAVLGALPPQSQLTWRAEIAVRATPDPYARRVMLRIIVRDAGRTLWRQPADITRSRPTLIPPSLLSPP